MIASSLARDVDVAGFVLAGGQSACMGTDKALVPLAGQPLVLYALTILRETGLRGSIAGARATLDSFAPVIEDSEQDQGPLGGICSALASTETRWAVFLPIDLPLPPTASWPFFSLGHSALVPLFPWSRQMGLYRHFQRLSSDRHCLVCVLPSQAETGATSRHFKQQREIWGKRS